MTGRLAGIARHDRPTGPMETVDGANVTVGEGVHGDYRGALASAKPGTKRQVSLIEGATCWWKACACRGKWARV
jgi:hypothetical protein